ncbi:tautomerase family protein [Rubrobacter naiadicus]|uniref:tautomerase family protein n=1 Tax=Rubrobacter naiadicus TaxID=1392641 RepID=UPI002361DB44|nr:hypothetical protein [Rubrobacter naiadicus]
MPMVEVIHSAEDELKTESRRAFARRALEIFQEVLGTPPGRLRLFFSEVPRTHTIEGLLEEQSAEDD